MPRVSEVLDYLTEPELVRWMENNSKTKRKTISDEALRIGFLVDSLVQTDIRDDAYLAPEDDEPVMNCMNAWEAFKKDNPGFAGSVISMQDELRKGEITGHPDFIVNDNGMGIIDLKTSSAIRPRHWTQTAAYAWLSGHTDFIGILRLDKKSGLYEFRSLRDKEYIAYEISIFKAYLLAYHHNEKNREVLRRALEEELL